MLSLFVGFCLLSVLGCCSSLWSFVVRCCGCFWLSSVIVCLPLSCAVVCCGFVINVGSLFVAAVMLKKVLLL